MRWLWPVLILAACSQAPEVVQSPGDIPGLLRNPTAPLASQADVTPARLNGDWVVRQDGSGERYHGGRIRFGDAPFALGLCGEGPCVADIALMPVGPGRWAVDAPSLPSGELWVLWMDFDDRTVVVGDTLANYVWILDRQQTGGADRIAAARDILKWYGYDLSRLESVQ